LRRGGGATGSSGLAAPAPLKASGIFNLLFVGLKARAATAGAVSFGVSRSMFSGVSSFFFSQGSDFMVTCARGVSAILCSLVLVSVSSALSVASFSLGHVVSFDFEALDG